MGLAHQSLFFLDVRHVQVLAKFQVWSLPIDEAGGCQSMEPVTSSLFDSTGLGVLVGSPSVGYRTSRNVTGPDAPVGLIQGL
jgi:hypothetical protein